MSPLFTCIVIIMGLLAVMGIVVGVANDAVNFLNSALGSKVAPRRVILWIAAAGILVGTLTSSDGLRVAGRRGRGGAVPYLGRRRGFHSRPFAIHQHGQGHGHHRGHPTLRGAGIRRRVAVHVRLAADLLVPLRTGVPPLGSRMVRHLAGRHPLFRPVQGTEKLGADPHVGGGLRRGARAGNAAGVLGRIVGGAVAVSAHAAQHHAHHDPFGHLRAGAGIRGERPGEFHRCAAGQLRRLADRPRSRQRVDHDGRTGRTGTRQFPAAVGIGAGDGADTVLLEEIAACHRDRAVARLAARG